MTLISVLRQYTADREAMMRIFIIIVAQATWGSALREIDQPGWAILARAGPAMAPEILKRLKVAGFLPRTGHLLPQLHELNGEVEPIVQKRYVHPYRLLPLHRSHDVPPCPVQPYAFLQFEM